MYDVESVLAVDRGSADIFSKESVIKHNEDGKALFAGRLLGGREMIGYYYWSHVHRFIRRQKQLEKAYEEGVLTVTMGLY